MALFKGLKRTGLGIDLGTTNIVVFQRGKGIIFDEPNVVAVRKLPRGGKEVIAYGMEAKAMEGKTPQGVSVIHPLKDGVIANYEMTEAVLSHYIRKAGFDRKFSKPAVVVSVPATVTEVERRAVIDAAMGAGAREAYILDEPLAAALGAGLPIMEPQGNMVVDIGGGLSEVAVISLGGIVVTNNARDAGDAMDQAIINMFRQRYEMVIGERTAESVKIQIGSVCPDDDIREIEVKGRDVAEGIPRSVIVSAADVREVLLPVVNQIVEIIRMTIESTPPELAKDILDCGIVLVGGAAQVRGMAEKLSAAVQAPVELAEDPIHCVPYGVGCAINDLEGKKSMLTALRKRAR